MSQDDFEHTTGDTCPDKLSVTSNMSCTSNSPKNGQEFLMFQFFPFKIWATLVVEKRRKWRGGVYIIVWSGLLQYCLETMADSWEDEDVDEVSVPVVSHAPASWEDEEDETLIEQAAAAAAGNIEYQ